jgi:hypothetical protein
MRTVSSSILNHLLFYSLRETVKVFKIFKLILIFSIFARNQIKTKLNL